MAGGATDESGGGESVNPLKTTMQLVHLDPTEFRPHPLHWAERDWSETNCWQDMMIETLNVLGLDPVAAARIHPLDRLRGEPMDALQVSPRGSSEPSTASTSPSSTSGDRSSSTSRSPSGTASS